MGIKETITQSGAARYAKVIRETPREIIFNRTLLFSVTIYALAAVPSTWDQGSAATVPSLRGFQQHFHLTSGANADQISFIVSLPYLGYAAGSALSFFINDTLGRRWSYRLYVGVWTIGQLVAIFAPNIKALYAARIISGLGIGPLTVIGPMSIVEIAPTETRGLLTSWYVVAMNIALFTANFCVYGLYVDLPASRLQYQIVWFAPCIFMFLCVVASFFIKESPRWLMMVDRGDEAMETLSELRKMPVSHPRLQSEIHALRESIHRSQALSQGGVKGLAAVVRETFTVPSNLRRLQQALLSYLFAQLSGANSVTSYFIPIMKLIGNAKSTKESIFLSGMYSLSKLFFSLMCTFFFVDVLGRRGSLFVGITIQMISHVYIGVFIKYNQEGSVTQSASEAAIAAVFIHGFGYAVGLYVLPYIFGGELWPDRIRSFGGALGQTFHWLFIYAIKASLPSMFSSMDNWGAFIFFAGWCFVALIYVYLMVPEVAGLSIEEIDDIFKGPWLNATRRGKRRAIEGVARFEANKLHGTTTEEGDQRDSMAKE